MPAQLITEHAAPWPEHCDPYPKGFVCAQMLEACDQVEAFARCLLSGVFDAENTWVRSRRDKINDSDVLK